MDTLQLYRAVVRKDVAFVEFHAAKLLQNLFQRRLCVSTVAFLRQIGHHDGGSTGGIG